MILPWAPVDHLVLSFFWSVQGLAWSRIHWVDSLNTAGQPNSSNRMYNKKDQILVGLSLHRLLYFLNKSHSWDISAWNSEYRSDWENILDGREYSRLAWSWAMNPILTKIKKGRLNHKHISWTKRFLNLHEEFQMEIVAWFLFHLASLLQVIYKYFKSGRFFLMKN